MVSSRRRRLPTATTTTTAVNTSSAPPVEVQPRLIDDELRRAEIKAADNAELMADAQNVLATIRTCRPKNTWRAYEPKQREFYGT